MDSEKNNIPVEKKKGLNKLSILLQILAVVFFIFWAFTLTKNHKLMKEKADIQFTYDNAIKTINDVQDSLELFAQKELNITQILIERNKKEKLSEEEKTKMLKTLSDIRSYIKEKEEMLNDLQNRIATNDAQIQNLKRMIENYKRLLDNKEKEINELKNSVTNLTDEVSNLKTRIAEQVKLNQQREEEISAKTKRIESQEEMLNTVYYIVGTEKELKNLGIIKKVGGFLALGRTTTVSKNLSDFVDYFKDLNLAGQNEIFIDKPLDKIKVLTNQSQSSYELKDDGNGNSIFSILNIEEFRKIKYLVITYK